MKTTTRFFTAGAGLLVALATAQTASAATCDLTYAAAKALHDNTHDLHDDFKRELGRHVHGIDQRLLAEFCELEEDVCEVMDDLRDNKPVYSIHPRVHEIEADLKRIDALLCQTRLSGQTSSNLQRVKWSFRSFDQKWHNLLAQHSAPRYDDRDRGHNHDHDRDRGRFDGHRVDDRRFPDRGFDNPRFPDQGSFRSRDTDQRQMDARRFPDRYSQNSREVTTRDIIRYVGEQIPRAGRP